MEQCKELGPMVGYCGHLGKRCLDGHLRRYDVTPVQARVILYLTEYGDVGRTTQRDLERELRLKAPTVNGVVERMEEKGLITRRTSSHDGRCRVLLLTEKGRETAEQFHEAARRLEEIYLSTLTQAEQEVLRDLMGRLIRNLETEVNRL